MSEPNGVRRYFNLAGVVRDLEHASSPDATHEGRGLWERFVAVCDEAFASAMDAESESEDEDESDVGDDADVGDEVSVRGGQDGRRLGGHDDGSIEMRHRIAALESALANLQRPQGEVSPGAPPVDGTGGGRAVRHDKTKEMRKNDGKATTKSRTKTSTRKKTR